MNPTKECDPEQFVIQNRGRYNFDDCLDDGFYELKCALRYLQNNEKVCDVVFWIETRFYATYRDEEQCEVQHIHRIPASGINFRFLEHELECFEESVRRLIQIEILNSVKRNAWGAMSEVNALEFRMTTIKDKDAPKNTF